MSMIASVTADYGDKAYVFKLRSEHSGDDCTVEVMEPENIAGITAHSDPDSSVLEFDGVILDTGDLNASGLSPMNCLPLIKDAWLNGHVEEALFVTGQDSEILSVSYAVSDDTQVVTEFDRTTSLPLNAQIIVDGYTAIYCTFQNIVIQ